MDKEFVGASGKHIDVFHAEVGFAIGRFVSYDCASLHGGGTVFNYISGKVEKSGFLGIARLIATARAWEFQPDLKKLFARLEKIADLEGLM